MSIAAGADPERHARLLQAKLHALVRDHTGVEGGELGGHAGAATLRRDGEGWYLADRNPVRALGPALAWARQQGVAHLSVLVDGEAAGVVARRAEPFADPPDVWRVDGRVLHRATPAPYPPPSAPPPSADTLVELLTAAGAEVVVEHGVLAGEVLGLEMARVVVDEAGEPRLEVGVGRNDREAFQLLHGDLPRPDALRSVIDAVRSQRKPGGEGHPLTRLAQERWLRARLLAGPSLVGLDALTPVEPIVPRDSVKDVVPAGAVGADAAGAVVVVCSVGVDLDLVPEAADLRRRVTGGDDARLVLVLPERDALPATAGLATLLRHPAEVVTIPGDWRS